MADYNSEKDRLWKDHTEKRLDDLENKTKDLDKTISEIKEQQAETRIYVKQIFDILNELKDNFSELRLKDQMNGTTSDERQNNQEAWLSFVKWVIGGTIFIIVIAMFGQSNGFF